MRKFWWKSTVSAEFSWSARNFAETLPFHKTSTPENKVNFRYFTQYKLTSQLFTFKCPRGMLSDVKSYFPFIETELRYQNGCIRFNPFEFKNHRKCWVWTRNDNIRQRSWSRFLTYICFETSKVSIISFSLFP